MRSTESKERSTFWRQSRTTTDTNIKESSDDDESRYCVTSESYNCKNVSYRKQIARQHSCHNFGRAEGMVDAVKSFSSSLIIKQSLIAVCHIAWALIWGVPKIWRTLGSRSLGCDTRRSATYDFLLVIHRTTYQW